MYGVEEWQRYVILLLDEMHIREDVVYNKHDGSVVGFFDLGDINNHLQRFEHLISGKQSRIQHPAKSMFNHHHGTRVVYKIKVSLCTFFMCQPDWRTNYTVVLGSCISC